MRRAAVGSFLALVTGCGETPSTPAQRPATPPAARVATSPTSPASRYSHFEWIKGVQGHRAGLTFAIPETDAVGVTLECDRGSRIVRLASVDPARQGTRITFGSGDAHAEMSATPSHDTDYDDAYWAVAMVSTDHLVFTAFKATDALWVWDAGAPMAAHSRAERDAIASFFRFCDEP